MKLLINLFDAKPEAIQELGTGYYNIHLNIEEVQVEQINEEVEEFQKYFDYCESCKNIARNALGE